MSTRQALILASGIGIRLLPLTDNIPKCLIEVKGKTLLGRIIDSLLENNINDIIITTGHLEEKIKEFIKKEYPQIKVEFVFNPKYGTTNYIY